MSSTTDVSVRQSRAERMRLRRTALLGGLSPAAFLRRHWQKRPLIVRQAVPGFTGILDRDQLLAVAERPDATSRLVLHHPRRRARWERHDGPFGGLDADMLPASHWTLLVHGVESLVPGGWELLRRFSFIPAARVDDLMVSYAAPGGSVGPHVDAYDVFLLQGPGRRRWQISSQRDHATDPDAAIKVLRSFRPEEEWILEPGDMLYLPPGVAHLGIAETACFTYSVGFLAPTHQELVREFLGYLAAELPATLDPAAIYQDPDLTPSKDPLTLPAAMLAQVAAILRRIRWTPAMQEDFLGRLLTRPKSHALFTPPSRPLPPKTFAARLRARGRLTLSLPTRALLRPPHIFLNGERHTAGAGTMRVCERLVTERALRLPLRVDAATRSLLHGWHTAGYLGLARS